MQSATHDFHIRSFFLKSQLAADIGPFFLNILAVAEINILLAVLFRPEGPKLELFETDESDVTPVHDFLVSIPKLDTKGVRVIIDWIKERGSQGGHDVGGCEN